MCCSIVQCFLLLCVRESAKGRSRGFRLACCVWPFHPQRPLEEPKKSPGARTWSVFGAIARTTGIFSGVDPGDLFRRGPREEPAASTEVLPVRRRERGKRDLRCRCAEEEFRQTT